MHGIEKVTDRIAQDAQAEIEAQLSQAQERADQILAEYETQAREAVERILAHGQREVDAHRAQLHSMARLEARKRVLAAKQDVIEAAFEKALARLCALPREKMVPLLARLAAVYAETGEEEVILPPASRRAYGQDVVDQANQQMCIRDRTGGLQSHRAHQEEQLNQLACIVRQHIDLPAIYEAMGQNGRGER